MPARVPEPRPRRVRARSRLRGFPPIAGPGARVLVLGSMPGVASLAAGQYYAHPRNAFWNIAATVLGFDAAAPYAERVAALVAAQVALWDVVAACRRQGSLDADIEAGSVKVNRFAAFFASQPGIRRVCFNGAAAAGLYARHVRPALGPQAGIEFLRLPSTSPANAACRPAARLAAWRVALLPPP